MQWHSAQLEAISFIVELIVVGLLLKIKLG